MSKPKDEQIAALGTYEADTPFYGVVPEVLPHPLCSDFVFLLCSREDQKDDQRSWKRAR